MIARKKFLSEARSSQTVCWIAEHHGTIFLMGRWPVRRPRWRKGQSRIRNVVALEKTSSALAVPAIVEKYKKMLEDV